MRLILRQAFYGVTMLVPGCTQGRVGSRGGKSKKSAFFIEEMADTVSAKIEKKALERGLFFVHFHRGKGRNRRSVSSAAIRLNPGLRAPYESMRYL